MDIGATLAAYSVMQQYAFAPAFGTSELPLLEHAGLMGKEVRLIPSLRQPS